MAHGVDQGRHARRLAEPTQHLNSQSRRSREQIAQHFARRIGLVETKDLSRATRQLVRMITQRKGQCLQRRGYPRGKCLAVPTREHDEIARCLQAHCEIRMLEQRCETASEIAASDFAGKGDRHGKEPVIP